MFIACTTSCVTDERKYLEFDEDHIFICAEHQMHIYSRRGSRAKILSFPPSPLTSGANVIIRTEGIETAETRLLSTRDTVPTSSDDGEGYRRTPVTVASLPIAIKRQGLDLDPMGQGEPLDFCA
jgi:hypothetical protein